MRWSDSPICIGGNMFGSGHNVGFIKCFARVLITLSFLASKIAPSYAQNLTGSAAPQRGAASFAGPAAMLGVRISFGAERMASSQPVVGLRFGASWRADPGSMSPQSYRFIPTAEVGFSFRGDPILRLGSYEVRLNTLHASAAEAQGGTFCGRNLGLCIAGGVAVAAVAVIVLVGSDNCEAPLPEYPPGEHPCRCYEADGC
jgi:hypothetical protein